MNKNYIIIIILVIIIALFFGYNQISKPTIQQQNNQNENIIPQTSKEIVISNFSFSPSEMRARVGDKITWTNNDSAPHQIIANSFSSNLLNKGESFSFTFNNKGSYDYHCSIHPSMVGKIIIE